MIDSFIGNWTRVFARATGEPKESRQNDSKTCPVCGHQQSKTANKCAQCGWNYPVILGSGEAVAEELDKRLIKARLHWQSNRYQLDSEPELERDPFETWDEFSIRLSSQLWCAGEVVLDKNRYDIEKSRFYIDLHIKPWTKPLGWKLMPFWLSLDRDEAKALYLSSTKLPLYVELELTKQKPNIKRVLVFTGEQEIEVATDKEEVIGQLGNEERYSDHQDGTVTDNQTGLMWMKRSIGQRWQNGEVKGEAKSKEWREALQLNGTEFAGYSDWRLPTIEELNTLVYSSTGEREMFDNKGFGGRCLGTYQEPTIDLICFPNTPAGLYWSSSHFGCKSHSAWTLGFGSGYVSNESKGSKLYVRLVRSL